MIFFSSSLLGRGSDVLAVLEGFAGGDVTFGLGAAAGGASG